MSRSSLILVFVGALVLAGCTADATPSLTTRHTLEDSVLLLTVDQASEGLAYGDLLILVNNIPFRHGGAADASQRIYEVAGKDNPTDGVTLGDIIRVPFAGKASVELRHGGGTSLQQLDVTVPDKTAPPTPEPLAPQRAATGVDRETVFQWAPALDVSGVRYQLEYWIASQGASAPHVTVPDLNSVTYAVPSDSALLPATPYRWQVRAVDGAGNIGPWSAEAEFTTSIG